MISALSLLLSPSALPILVSCSSGHWLTGTVIGCWRKVCGWSLSSISAEYRRFGTGGDDAGRGGMNEQFIELFDTELVQGGRRERERRRNRGAAPPASALLTGRRAAGGGNSEPLLQSLQ